MTRHLIIPTEFPTLEQRQRLLWKRLVCATALSRDRVNFPLALPTLWHDDLSQNSQRVRRFYLLNLQLFSPSLAKREKVIYSKKHLYLGADKIRGHELLKAVAWGIVYGSPCVPPPSGTMEMDVAHYIESMPLIYASAGQCLGTRGELPFFFCFPASLLWL